VALAEAGEMILARVADYLHRTVRALPVPRFHSGAIAS
jgi:hypothetical protein